MSNNEHQRAAEMHDAAAHAHRTAELKGKQTYPSSSELSRQALERSTIAHQQSVVANNTHGISFFGHHQIAELAHQLWLQRGRPEGSPQQDWFDAAKQLRSRNEN